MHCAASCCNAPPACPSPTLSILDRLGVFDALDAIEGRAGLTLCVRPGEGTEPADLLERVGVRLATAAEQTTLDGIDAVLAPAGCEAVLQQVAVAVQRGIPVLASDRVAWQTGPPPAEVGAWMRARLMAAEPPAGASD